MTQSMEPRFQLGALYLAGFAAFAVPAVAIGGWAWLLLWPAGSCLIVAGIYFVGNPALFQKHDGSVAPAMLCLLAPYLLAAWLNSRSWTQGQPLACQLSDDVWIGRLATRAECEAIGIRSVVDLAAELPAQLHGSGYRCVPVLDLTAPDATQLDEAVEAIESLESQRPTLVCCALGYSRSAAAAVAWLVASRRAQSVQAAIATVERCRPQVVLTAEHRSRLDAWARARSGK